MKWKEYKGYKVSNTGVVISKSGKQELRQRIFSGYKMVNICDGNKVIPMFVHRLVALLFVNNPNPNSFKYVNHIDENKLNNNSSNLEWCNAKYNRNYGDPLLKSIRSKQSKIKIYNTSPVKCILKNVSTGETLIFDSMRKTSKFLYGKETMCISKKDGKIINDWLIYIQA